MPSQNEVKELLPDGIYHVFNRGVERREVFLDGHDYRRFLRQLSQSLEREPSVSLLAYSLMPNHFHLLIKQTEPVVLGSFLQRLTIAYVMYFNRKYRRVGPLFQGKYKAVRVIGPRQLMEVSRYIHLNPERAGLGWRQHAYSSVAVYTGKSEGEQATPQVVASGPTIDAKPVLTLFDMPGDYKHYLATAKLRS
jgi:putative transposase